MDPFSQVHEIELRNASRERQESSEMHVAIDYE